MVASTAQIRNENLPQQLLARLAEELKVPLALAASSLELAELAQDTSGLASARFSAESALALVNHYALGLKLANLGQGEVALEPVAVTAVMAEALAELAPLAAAYDVRLTLENNLRCHPVLANRQALVAALVSSGSSLIEALPASESGQQTLKLSSHSSRAGIVAGWYWQAEKVTSELLARGQALLASSCQPLSDITHSQASGVFIADMLLACMDSRLIASKHRHWTGLAATLQPSRQLALIH